MHRKTLALLLLLTLLTGLIGCTPASRGAQTDPASPALSRTTPDGGTQGSRAVDAGGKKSGGAGGKVIPNWRQLDLNRDGRFDREDYDILIREGFWKPGVDINQDGALDSRDAWAAMVQLTRWDRNADGQVDDADSAPPGNLTLPIPNESAATALVANLLKESEAKVPADQEERFMGEWRGEGLDTSDPQVLAALFEAAGSSALIMGNLEVAQWAYARAATLAPQRATAFSSLGFLLTENQRYEETLVALAQARQLDPTLCVAISNIGAVFSRDRQLDQALTFYQSAEAACPTLAQFSLHVGAIQLRLENDSGAKAAFDLAVQKNPGDMQAMNQAVRRHHAADRGEMAEPKSHGR